ncbi:MAG: exodeoxyribonuclease V subunit beta [Rhodocyclaceae bacterium]|nr:exodeoxyribonuclease V subunit beta [Rhodocyclaceae bacterium]
MNELRTLQVDSVPLDGLQAIEASAGTGKTWSIAALYLRLLLECALPVERILVVTFTKAATAELRRRIRTRLAAARSALQSGEPGDDAVLRALLPRLDAAQAVVRLTLAIESFDLAAIHTIHGFCQRALAERAFESAQAFDAELLSDDSALLRETVEDVWRNELAAADADWAAWLTRRLPGPAALLSALRPHLGKPYLIRLPPPSPDASAEAACQRALDEARQAWADGRESAIALLTAAGDHLKQNIYSPPQLAAHAALTDAWMRHDGALPANSLTLFTPGKLAGSVKKGGEVPRHPLFAVIERLLATRKALDDARERRYGHFLLRALEAWEDRLMRRKDERNLQTFDDLLLRLHRALEGEGGADLAEALRVRYGAALIDEFQDTDPLQYAIFRCVFAAGKRPLFFVGDPKQAIYSFRGADLQAYFNARDEAGAPWHLATNYRSLPALVAAVNALFAARPQPFFDPRLEFVAVAAAPHPPAPLTVDGDDGAPLCFWFLPREAVDAKGKPKALDKGHARQRIAAAVAADIARLLNLAAAGMAKIGDRALSGGDIAVLVKSHHEGRLMRAALAARGVACVRYGQDSVFDSREAMEIERLLLAVAEPSHGGLLRAALATDLLGWRGAELFALERDGVAWDACFQRFRRWHVLAQERGFIAMWSALLGEMQVAPRLLAQAEGERRMTNLQHLSELLHRLAHERSLDVAALAKHLADERSGAGGSFDSEARLLRLESDAQLVKIVTVHGAKGLEYPLVYCPFLWDGVRSFDGETPLKFHAAAGEHAATLDFGSAERAVHGALAQQERRAELLRLAYVALTRAKCRCIVAWGAMNDAETSALAWLLHGAVGEDFKALDDAALRADLDGFATTCASIAAVDLPEGGGSRYALPASDAAALAARPFVGRIAPAWRTHSFTAWQVAAEAEAEAEAAQLPDHDAATPPAAVSEFAGAADLTQDVSVFPRGANAGSALHALLETADFARFDPAGVAAGLRGYGIAAAHAPAAAQLLRDTLAADLDGRGLRLAALDPARQLRELEFLFPIAAPDMARLAAAIGPGQGADGRLDRRVARLQVGTARGFLKGYIDLAFEYEGRLHLLDYKSNWLGPRFADYGAESLAAAMAEADYDLQALLYAVALHRLLTARRTDYAPQRHLGGAYYLFLRGIDPARPGSGVHFWQPEAALVERVDACLARQERIFS